MVDPNHAKIDRRRVLKQAAALSAAIPAAAAIQPARNLLAADTSESTASTLIRDENSKPGSKNWQLTRVRLDTRGGIRA
ncbi:MAG: hypothetical protein KDB00_23220, partial [Planctomycetales bacterium]|nr:hypothetical protein [Planctomycetales bacterium]